MRRVIRVLGACTVLVCAMRHTVWADATDALVRIRLVTTDGGGSPISEVGVGGNFQLRALVLDLRTFDNIGVFSAFTDVSIDPVLATASGPIVHGADYALFPTGTVLPDELDEVGGLSGSITPLGPSERLLFAVPFTANEVGTINFTANQADDFASEVLLYGNNPPIPPAQVLYGTASLVIRVPEPTSLALTAVAAIGLFAGSRVRRRSVPKT